MSEDVDDTLVVNYIGTTTDGIKHALTRQPANVAFRPERVMIDPPSPGAADWVILDIGVVHVVHESLVAEAWRFDRRKAGRKIRQNRRRIRRLAEGRFDPSDERVPESVKILLARAQKQRTRRKNGR